MRAMSGFGDLIDRHRISLYHAKHAGKGLVELGKCGQTAAVAFHRNDLCPSAQQGAGQATWTWPHLIDRLIRKRPRHTRDPIEQLGIEQEILA
jgi:hypothetical protein